MLPLHPLLSEHAALFDPHQQWARLVGMVPESKRESLEAAFRLMLRAHATQWRRTAENSPAVPLSAHPVRVGCILAHEWEITDSNTLATALLHHVLEARSPDQRPEFAQQIADVAGEAVEQAVWSLTKAFVPEPVPVETRARRDAQYFRVVRAAPAWVRLVKCADRLDNLRDAIIRGDRDCWVRYSSETIGWHLHLARETSPTAEMALFGALVEGERTLNGRAPVWVDGHLVDVSAAAVIPEHVARRYAAVGIELRGATLVVGAVNPIDPAALMDLKRSLFPQPGGIAEIDQIAISESSFQDAIAAGLYGRVAVEASGAQSVDPAAPDRSVASTSD